MSGSTAIPSLLVPSGGRRLDRGGPGQMTSIPMRPAVDPQTRPLIDPGGPEETQPPGPVTPEPDTEPESHPEPETD